MWRLNVRAAQIDECIQESMFAISNRPQHPPLNKGDILLLQLVKGEAEERGQLNGRITFAIVFDHLEQDHDGSISRAHWPSEGRVWPWIIYGSATIPTLPFSLENIGLSRDYAGQTNPMHIAEEDQAKVLPYVEWAVPQAVSAPTSVQPTRDRASVLKILQARSRTKGNRKPNRRMIETSQFDRDIWLAEGLKAFYGYRCQVCGQDFTSIYGVPYAETHHIDYLRNSGPDTLENMIVLCPNHHRLVHATNARFDRDALAYLYPNGVSEELLVTDHFRAGIVLPTLTVTE